MQLVFFIDRTIYIMYVCVRVCVSVCVCVCVRACVRAWVCAIIICTINILITHGSMHINEAMHASTIWVASGMFPNTAQHTRK